MEESELSRNTNCTNAGISERIENTTFSANHRNSRTKQREKGVPVRRIRGLGYLDEGRSVPRNPTKRLLIYGIADRRDAFQNVLEKKKRWTGKELPEKNKNSKEEKQVRGLSFLSIVGPFGANCGQLSQRRRIDEHYRLMLQRA